MDEKMKNYYDPIFRELTEEEKANTKILINHIDRVDPSTYINLNEEDTKRFLETLANTPEANRALKDLLSPMYNVIADEDELRWFFEHIIQRPAVNESYSAVFVSRHKKLTDEEAVEIGLTRKEAEFLATQTFKLRNIKDAQSKDDPDLWSFENFIKVLRRFNVDKRAYTTAKGLPIPAKTLAVIFYVNPGDDMKVCRKFVEEYNDVNEAITKAMLGGKTTESNYQSYQWFGKAESTIKHLKANQKGTRYWLDFDVDVPAWFKDGKNYEDKSYYQILLTLLDAYFKKGNYVIIDTSGGYHILVKTSAIKQNPHNFCKHMKDLYDDSVKRGEEPYLDEKGNCKFECIVNDSQIPGLPLPGTYQYDRPVTVLNKEDFE